MSYGFFVLQRFFLRVDNVLFRIFDTRIYHAFDSREIIRETKGRQASYKRVKDVSFMFLFQRDAIDFSALEPVDAPK